MFPAKMVHGKQLPNGRYMTKSYKKVWKKSSWDPIILQNQKGILSNRSSLTTETNNHSWWLNLPNRQTWNNVVQNCGTISSSFPLFGSRVAKLPTNKSLKPLTLEINQDSTSWCVQPIWKINTHVKLDHFTWAMKKNIMVYYNPQKNGQYNPPYNL